MYGLPADFDPRPFIDRELTQIWFQTYSMQFFFKAADEEIQVTLESSFTYQRNSDSALIRQKVPVEGSFVTELIGKRVVDALASVDGTLTLRFEGDAVLQVLDDNPQYESYQIAGPLVGAIV